MKITYVASLSDGTHVSIQYCRLDAVASYEAFRSDIAKINEHIASPVTVPESSDSGSTSPSAIIDVLANARIDTVANARASKSMAQYGIFTFLDLVKHISNEGDWLTLIRIFKKFKGCGICTACDIRDVLETYGIESVADARKLLAATL